jgi:microcystin-dependent protein
MSQPYLGQIEAFPFNFAPKNWQPCQGQLLPINQNQALFSLLGTTYGGDGRTTFALPDLRGRAAMGQGNGGGLTQRVIGQIAGEENHTVTLPETPMHTHTFNTAPNGATTGNVDTPGPTMTLGNATGLQGTAPIPINPYAVVPPAPATPLAPTAIALNNGGQPHNNMMPFLVLEFCIAMSGIFPSRN